MGNYMPTPEENPEGSTSVESIPDYHNSRARFNPDNGAALRDARVKRVASQTELATATSVVADYDTKNEDAKIAAIDHTQYEFDFDNVVFEGGGAKGIVYVGALQVFEEVGIKPKRYAGASAGAMVAALAAVGYNSEEICEVLKLDLEELLLDHKWGYLSLLPNLLNHFGWNPGEKLLSKFAELLADKTGNPDVTFKELYDDSGIELCIMAVNVNMMRAEYFHPKTTPNLPIKLAVRMSMSIPGVFQPIPMESPSGATDYFVDGGVLCNYPIHAFDGWFLSMKLEDTFLNRIQPLSQFSKFMDMNVRFKERNEKTIGFIVYSSREQDLMRDQLEKRVGVAIKPEDRPNTKLFKDRKKEVEEQNIAVLDHEIFVEAYERFLLKLKQVEGFDGQADDMTSKAELQKALENLPEADEYDPNATEFNTYDRRILFGDSYDIDTLFDAFDTGHHGQLSYEDLCRFLSRVGVNINKKYQGYDRQPTNKLGQFFSVLTSSWLTNSTKMYLKSDDIDRTVGINCDYIETMDFDLSPADREFAINRGRVSTIAFLKHHIFNNPDKVKKRSSY